MNSFEHIINTRQRLPAKRLPYERQALENCRLVFPTIGTFIPNWIQRFWQNDLQQNNLDTLHRQQAASVVPATLSHHSAVNHSANP